jgi:2,5-dioxopentanoate dehydrogenase
MSEAILIAGQWRPAHATNHFQAENPSSAQMLEPRYPISSREDVLEATQASFIAAQELRRVAPEQIAVFLERLADLIDEHREALVEIAHLETGLPPEPRLNSVELPRTTNQLRQAAQAARDRHWTLPTIDTQANLRSMHKALGGAVIVFGPNNFPFAFNGIAGGDFAAAIAAGNPVIAKANPGHPGTTKQLAQLAHQAVLETQLPRATVQMLYHLEPDVGLEMISHEHTAAVAFTGSRSSGLKLKEVADRAGKPIYLELSSINPVLILPAALNERCQTIADEFFASCTASAGQFCTNPGLVILPPRAEDFVEAAKQRFNQTQGGVLLGRNGLQNLIDNTAKFVSNGARLITGGHPISGAGYRFENTLFAVSGSSFLKHSSALQTEAFGAVSLLVQCEFEMQMLDVTKKLEGNLTGTIYSSHTGGDDALYAQLEPLLRGKVGRLLNDKMPTGVAVSAAMNHGGPFPATGHPGFSAVGFPGSVRRFSALQSYDHVRSERLPLELQDQNSLAIWRFVDGQWQR